MRLPSARGSLVSLGLASIALWLTAAAAQAQEPLPAVSLPKAPAAATTVAKTAAPAVTKGVEAAKAVTAPARSAVTTTVSRAAKSVPAPVQLVPPQKAAPAAKPVQRLEEQGINVVREVMAPVEQVVEAVAPTPVAALINSVEPTVEEIAASAEPIVGTADREITIEPIQSTPPVVADVALAESKQQTAAVVERVDASPAEAGPAPTTTAVANEVRGEEPVVVVEEPAAQSVAPTIAAGDSHPISVTPVLAILEIHDALAPTRTETLIATTWPSLEAAPKVVTLNEPSTVDEAPQVSTVTANVHAPSAAITRWSDASPREASAPAEPWLPLSTEGSAAPASMPITAIGTGSGPPGAIPPSRGQLSLFTLWQALRQRALFEPVSVAVSNLAPPG